MQPCVTPRVHLADRDGEPAAPPAEEPLVLRSDVNPRRAQEVRRWGDDVGAPVRTGFSGGTGGRGGSEGQSYGSGARAERAAARRRRSTSTGGQAGFIRSMSTFGEVARFARGRTDAHRRRLSAGMGTGLTGGYSHRRERGRAGGALNVNRAFPALRVTSDLSFVLSPCCGAHLRCCAGATLL